MMRNPTTCPNFPLNIAVLIGSIDLEKSPSLKKDFKSRIRTSSSHWQKKRERRRQKIGLIKREFQRTSYGIYFSGSARFHARHIFHWTSAYVQVLGLTVALVGFCTRVGGRDSVAVA